MVQFKQQGHWLDNHNVLTGVACGGVLLLVACYFYLGFDGNITGFFRIGSEFPHSPFLNLDRAFIFNGEIGHDGQQFLTVAFDPFLQHPGTLDALDIPSYRYRRILYPLLGYALAGGNREIIPYVLVALNILAAIGLVRIAALFFRRDRRDRSWMSLMMLCIPGVWFCLLLSTAGLLAACLAIAAHYYYKRKPVLATTLIVLSCLTRETSMLYWGALVFASAMDSHRPQLKSLLVGGILPIAWIGYIASRPDLQRNAALAVNDNFDVPLLGIVQKLQLGLANTFEPKMIYEWLSFGLLFAVFVCLCWLWIFHRDRIKDLRGFAISSLLTVGLFSVCSRVVLGYYLDYNRVFIMAYCLLLLGLVVVPCSSYLARIVPLLFAMSGMSCLIYFALAS